MKLPTHEERTQQRSRLWMVSRNTSFTCAKPLSEFWGEGTIIIFFLFVHNHMFSAEALLLTLPLMQLFCLFVGGFIYGVFFFFFFFFLSFFFFFFFFFFFLSSIVSSLSLFWCLRKAVLRYCGSSWVASLILFMHKYKDKYQYFLIVKTALSGDIQLQITRICLVRISPHRGCQIIAYKILMLANI